MTVRRAPYPSSSGLPDCDGGAGPPSYGANRRPVTAHAACRMPRRIRLATGGRMRSGNDAYGLRAIGEAMGAVG